MNLNHFLMIFALIRSFLQAWSKCDFKSKYWRFDFKSNLFFGSNILLKYVLMAGVKRGTVDPLKRGVLV
jgi:hypothetical protein